MQLYFCKCHSTPNQNYFRYRLLSISSCGLNEFATVSCSLVGQCVSISQSRHCLHCCVMLNCCVIFYRILTRGRMSNLRTSISICDGLSATTDIMYCCVMFTRILTQGRVSNLRTSISVCGGLSATTNQAITFEASDRSRSLSLALNCILASD